MLFTIFLESKLLIVLVVFLTLNESTCLIFPLRLGFSHHVDTPMDSCIQLDIDQGDPFHDVGCYQCLVGKLIYLTVTQTDYLCHGLCEPVSACSSSPTF